MPLLRAAVMLFVSLLALGVVRTRDPRHQAIAVSFYGLVLSVMFLLYEAPDVALSQLVVGAVALPLMILLALARIRRDAEQSK